MAHLPGAPRPAIPEAPPSSRRLPTPGPAGPQLMLKLAARSPGDLQRYAADVYAFLQATPEPLDDVLYTLNAGRRDYACRLAVAAPDKPGLLGKLLPLVCTRGDGDAAVRPGIPAGRYQELALLFSDGAFTPGELAGLSAAHPVFGETFEALRRGAAPGWFRGALVTFAAQYALFRVWQSLGISFSTIIGTGVGKITGGVVKGTYSLAEAVGMICRDEVSNAPPDAAKLKSAVRRLLEGPVPVFLEMGPSGSLSAHLHPWRAQWNALRVCCAFDAATGYSPLARLAGLYELGVRVDWEMFYAGCSLRRVKAPAYPFGLTRRRQAGP